jgi:hypothetical protein
MEKSTIFIIIVFVAASFVIFEGLVTTNSPNIPDISNLNIPYFSQLQSQSHLQTFVDTMHENYLSNSSDSTRQLTAWQDTPDGSDTIRVQYDLYNSSNPTVPTTTFNMRIIEFHTKGDATNFVNSINEGYSVRPLAVTNDYNAYENAMGHSPSTVKYFMKADSVYPPKASIIIQFDEFVSYGTATGIMA